MSLTTKERGAYKRGGLIFGWKNSLSIWGGSYSGELIHGGEEGGGAYLRNSNQDSKFMILAFAFECSNVRTFDFIDVMNSHIAIHNYLFIFRLLFTFKHVGWVKKQMQLQKIT